VLLFDEIEKAHGDVFNILLQILDDGRLTDAQGRTVDFKNTVVIMTSNLGADRIQQYARQGGDFEQLKEDLMDLLRRSFRPEFINRIDEIIVFHALSEEHIKGIVQLMIARVNKQLEERSIRVELTSEAEDLLIRKGYDATYGARQLRRTIQKHIEDPLAEAIVGGRFQDGAQIEVRVEGDSFTFAPLAEPSLNLAEH